ncbi:MAG: hypothetical protein ACI4SB_05935 [Acutalibacteraceae bacterium]
MKNIKRFAAIAVVLCLIVSMFAACSASPQKKIIGVWRDSTGTVGYEFKEDNICNITYADFTIPIVNIRYDGTVPGTYTITKRDDGNYYVQIKYTVISSQIVEDYMFTVEGDALTLTNVESNDQKTLIRQAQSQPTVSDTNQTAATSAS